MFGFCWILSAQVIGNDLGASYDKSAWGKYLTAFVFGLAWAFYFQPMREKEDLKDQQA